MDKRLSARQRRPSMTGRGKRRIGAFSKRLAFSDLDLRTNAGRFANSIKSDLEAQIGSPSAGQQILIKLIAIKVLRCEMMYDQVLSNPRGGDLQDRIENYFLAWSNSVRRDLEALGVLDSPNNIHALFGIDPAAMTDEQLDATMAMLERRLAGWAPAGAERSGEVGPIELEATASGCEVDAGS
jgi:hypothetical protein